ncbi:MAG: DEAD/DEAH box helicase [Acidimicrobiales bacterium]
MPRLGTRRLDHRTGSTAVTTTQQHQREDAFKAAAQAFVDGLATEEQLALLDSDRSFGVESLWRLLDAAEAALERARRDVDGPGRANILDDLDEECFRIDDAITRFDGPPTEDQLQPLPRPRTPEKPQTPEKKEEAPEPEGTRTTRLQLSWSDGRLIAWAGGHDADAAGHEQLRQLLSDAGAGSIDWTPGQRLTVPGSGKTDSLTAELSTTIGWLAGLTVDRSGPSSGPSVRWMGLVATRAIEHLAHGRFVPKLSRVRGRQGAQPTAARYRVRWAPAMLDTQAIEALAGCVPGTVMVGQPERDATAFTNAVLSDLVHTMVATAAAMVPAPAAPPSIRGKNDLAEAVLANLDGTEFAAPESLASDLSSRLNAWARPVEAKDPIRLIVQLDPPDDTNGWFAQVLVPVADGSGVEPLELAEASQSKSRSRLVAEHASRLERLFPALFRGGGRRRGQVVLSQSEAWRLMSDDGHSLGLAGFDMRVPKLSPKKATAGLRLTAIDSGKSMVGAQQLANVRWSVVFDDVELSADDIARLAAEAKPMVRSHGQWVEIDQVDLDAAAAALAERADRTTMTGADMLREALGLTGSPLAAGVSLAGDSWASNLFQSIEALPDQPEATPTGFAGTLRSYQADALAWLGFLHDAGLGGCLALDMGLGKTPTTLAAFAASTDTGTGLVIAPPAVVGNWAAEAQIFAPTLRVHLHHGASRAEGDDLLAIIAEHDLIITTYGTAVRDIDQLAEVEWSRIVIDEAQTIKNPTADVSQQLRRLRAHSRIALTGTPIENGLGDLWSILDWANPGLVGDRASFVANLTPDDSGTGGSVTPKGAGEDALKALNGVLVYRRTKAEPEIAAELPDRIDQLDHCTMTSEQIGLYQAVLDTLVAETSDAEPGSAQRKGAVLAAITALKQICNHPVNYRADDRPLEGRSGKLNRLTELIESVFAADEKMLVFTHFASWGERLAEFLTTHTGQTIECYHGGLARGARDRMIERFQNERGSGALVLSLKAGGTGLNLTAANHVVLYDRWWNPAVEDQARDRAWRIGQTKTVIAHRLVCPGTVDERVEQIVAGKRQIANLVLPKSSSIGDLDADQLQQALGIDADLLLTRDSDDDLAS